MKHAGAMGLSKPAGMKAHGHIQTPKPAKLHPASVQNARIRLPQGNSLPNAPAPMLPNVGKI